MMAAEAEEAVVHAQRGRQGNHDAGEGEGDGNVHGRAPALVAAVATAAASCGTRPAAAAAAALEGSKRLPRREETARTEHTKHTGDAQETHTERHRGIRN